MITDGKPSCLKMPDGNYYKNSVGLDESIVENATTWLGSKKIANSYYNFHDSTRPLPSTIRSYIHRN